MRRSKDFKQELNIEAMRNLLDHFRSLDRHKNQYAEFFFSNNTHIFISCTQTFGVIDIFAHKKNNL